MKHPTLIQVFAITAITFFSGITSAYALGE